MPVLMDTPVRRTLSPGALGGGSPPGGRRFPWPRMMMSEMTLIGTVRSANRRSEPREPSKGPSFATSRVRPHSY